MEQMDLLRLSLSLVVVVILILVAAWIARRTGFMRSNSNVIKFIAAHPLGNKSSIVVVEVENQKMVLGVSPQQVNLLHILPPSEAFETTLHSAVSAQQQQSSSETNTP